MFLVENQKRCKILNVSRDIMLPCIAYNFFEYRMKIKFDQDPLTVEQNCDLTKCFV